MGFLSVEQLQEGMILSEDVRDINSRLLLSKGQKVLSKQIRILKIWGITEVNVSGAAHEEEDEPSEPDPVCLEKAQEIVNTLFNKIDTKHPAIQEICRLAVEYRSRNGLIEADRTAPYSEVGSFKAGAGSALLKRIDRTDLKLPEIPDIILQLNEIIADPFASSNDIAQVVNKSPSLSALLLKIVNSAFYGFPSKIDNISRAVTLIGSKEITGMALGVSTLRIFRDIPEGILDMRSFFGHSLSCAILARCLAAHRNLIQTEQIFLSGLLHDIGRLIILKYCPDHAGVLFQKAHADAESLYETEKTVIGIRHPQIGSHLLKKWKLPQSLEQNVLYHHKPSLADEPEKAAIVHLADIITHAVGIGSSGEQIIPYFDEAAWESLKISPRVFQGLIRLAIHQFSVIETFIR